MEKSQLKLGEISTSENHIQYNSIYIRFKNMHTLNKILSRSKYVSDNTINKAKEWLTQSSEEWLFQGSERVILGESSGEPLT